MGFFEISTRHSPCPLLTNNLYTAQMAGRKDIYQVFCTLRKGYNNSKRRPTKSMSSLTLLNTYGIICRYFFNMFVDSLPLTCRSTTPFPSSQAGRRLTFRNVSECNYLLGLLLLLLLPLFKVDRWQKTLRLGSVVIGRLSIWQKYLAAMIAGIIDLHDLTAYLTQLTLNNIHT